MRQFSVFNLIINPLERGETPLEHAVRDSPRMRSMRLPLSVAKLPLSVQQATPWSAKCKAPRKISTPYCLYQKKLYFCTPKKLTILINQKNQNYVESVRNRFHYDARFI